MTNPFRYILLVGATFLFLASWQFVIPCRTIPAYAPIPAITLTEDPFFEFNWVSSNETREAHSAVVSVSGDTPIAIWYGGTEEGHRDVALFVSRFEDGWSAPHKVFDRNISEHALRRYIRKVGNPVLHSWDDGSITVFYVTVSVGGWAASSINHAQSDDLGRSWTSPHRLVTSPFLNLSTLVRTPPVTYLDGTIELPIYHEFIGKFAESLHIDRTGTILDKRRISSGTTMLQPTIAPLSENEAVAYLRYSGLAPGQVMRSRTQDGGQHWAEPVPTPLANPNSAVAVINLGDGTLLMALNDLEDGRHRLSLATRTTEPGDPWRIIHTLEEEEVSTPGSHEFEFSYPSFAVHGPEIHLLYTWNQERIRHARFNRAWLAEQQR